MTGAVGSFVEIERSGAVVTVTLDHPARRNALGPEMVTALLAAVDAIEGEREVRAVVLTGAGSAFCAGGDLRSPLFTAATAAERASIIAPGYELTRRMSRLRVPVVAAVNGACAGAGVLLACLCDVRVAAPDARFSLDFVRVGLLPDMGLTHLLPRIVGRSWAARLALFGGPIDAQQALHINLVTDVVPPDRVRAVAEDLAGRLAELPPLAVAAIKREIAAAPDRPFDHALDHEAAELNTLVATADCAAAVTAFLQRRGTEFQGR